MSRIRIKSDISRSDEVRVNSFYYGDEVSGYPKDTGAYTTHQYSRSRRFEGMEDVSTQNYHRLSGEGVVINSPMSKVYFDYLAHPGIATVHAYLVPDGTFLAYRQMLHVLPEPTALSYDFQANGLSTSLLIGVDTASIDDEREIAVTEAWANVDESDMLVLATLGELPETFAFIASVYRRFISMLKLFKSKKARVKLRAKLNHLSTMELRKLEADAMLDFWMEMRYALRPLCFEMAQAIAILEGKVRHPRHTARGHHSVSKNTETNVDTQWVSGFAVDPHLNVRTKSTRVSNYRAGVLYDVGLTDDSMKWLAVLGLDQPLESLLELTKLSFAIGWFINIGDLLASWTPNAQLTPLSSWVTEEHLLTEYVSGNGFYWKGTIPSNNSYSVGADYPWQRLEQRVTIRTPRPDLPVFPHVNINIDVAKIVDLVAIARNIYRAF